MTLHDFVMCFVGGSWNGIDRMIILKYLMIHWCYRLSASAECRAGICIFVSFCQLRPIQSVQPLFLSIWLRAFHQQRLEATTQHQVHPNTRCFSSLWPNSCHRRNRPGIRKSSRTLQVMIEFELLACHWTSKSPSVVPAFTIQTSHVSHFSKAMSCASSPVPGSNGRHPGCGHGVISKVFPATVKSWYLGSCNNKLDEKLLGKKFKKKTMPSGFNVSCPPGCALTCARHGNFKWFLTC